MSEMVSSAVFAAVATGDAGRSGNATDTRGDALFSAFASELSRRMDAQSTRQFAADAGQDFLPTTNQTYGNGEAPQSPVPAFVSDGSGLIRSPLPAGVSDELGHALTAALTTRYAAPQTTTTVSQALAVPQAGAPGLVQDANPAPGGTGTTVSSRPGFGRSDTQAKSSQQEPDIPASPALLTENTGRGGNASDTRGDAFFSAFAREPSWRMDAKAPRQVAAEADHDALLTTATSEQAYGSGAAMQSSGAAFVSDDSGLISSQLPAGVSSEQGNALTAALSSRDTAPKKPAEARRPFGVPQANTQFTPERGTATGFDLKERGLAQSGKTFIAASPALADKAENLAASLAATSTGQVHDANPAPSGTGATPHSRPAFDRSNTQTKPSQLEEPNTPSNPARLTEDSGRGDALFSALASEPNWRMDAKAPRQVAAEADHDSLLTTASSEQAYGRGAAMQSSGAAFVSDDSGLISSQLPAGVSSEQGDALTAALSSRDTVPQKPAEARRPFGVPQANTQFTPERGTATGFDLKERGLAQSGKTFIAASPALADKAENPAASLAAGQVHDANPAPSGTGTTPPSRPAFDRSNTQTKPSLQEEPNTAANPARLTEDSGHDDALFSALAGEPSWRMDAKAPRQAATEADHDALLTTATSEQAYGSGAATQSSAAAHIPADRGLINSPAPAGQSPEQGNARTSPLGTADSALQKPAEGNRSFEIPQARTQFTPERGTAAGSDLKETRKAQNDTGSALPGRTDFTRFDPQAKSSQPERKVPANPTVLTSSAERSGSTPAMSGDAHSADLASARNDVERTESSPARPQAAERQDKPSNTASGQQLQQALPQLGEALAGTASGKSSAQPGMREDAGRQKRAGLTNSAESSGNLSRSENALSARDDTDTARPAFVQELNRRMDASAPRQQRFDANDKLSAAAARKQGDKDDAALPISAASSQESKPASDAAPAGVSPELASLLASLASQGLIAPSRPTVVAPEPNATRAGGQIMPGDGNTADRPQNVSVERQDQQTILAGASAPAGNAVKFADALAGAARNTAQVASPEKSGSEAQELQINAQQDISAAANAAPLAAFHGVSAPVASAPDQQQPTSVPVHTPAGQPGWADEVSNRISWFAGHGESKAELVLTPTHLGKVEVTITVSGDQTTAQFVAATPAARDALEQALPRLRETLADAGISLGQTSVGTSSGESGTQGGSGRRARGGQARSIESASLHSSGTARWTQSGAGLVDTFA